MNFQRYYCRPKISIALDKREIFYRSVYGSVDLAENVMWLAGVCFFLLTFTLSFMGSAPIYIQPSGSIPVKLRFSDEETLHRLTAQYVLALTAGDLEAMRTLGNTQSASLTARFRYYQNLFGEARIELSGAKVTRLEITGDKAVSHLTADERRFDRKTGAILLTYDTLRGACRSFEWSRSAAGWKIEREGLIQDDLAARLDNAASEHDRDALLEKEKPFVTNTLVWALSNRGNRQHSRGEYDAAFHTFQIQKRVSERIGYQTGVAGAFMNLAQVKHSQEEHEVALEMARKAFALYESIGVKRGMVLTLEKLSIIYRTLGDHRRAFDCAQKSLRLSEEDKFRRGIMAAYDQLASIYGLQNNAEQALEHLEKALVIAQELRDPILIATMRHDAAAQYMVLGNYDKALEIYQVLLKQIQGDVAGTAMIRDQIGKVLAAKGQYAEAMSYYNQAFAELESVNMRHANVVVLNDMSIAYLAQGKYAETLPPAEQAVAISRETGRQLSLWLALTTLGYGQLGLSRTTEARQSFGEAVSIIESLRSQTAGGVGELQRYFESGLRAHHGMLSLMVSEKQTADALFLAERAKARVLLDVLQQGNVAVQKAMTTEEQEQERRLKNELTQLNKQLSRLTQADQPDTRRISDITPQLERARRNYEAFQNLLYAAHSDLKVHRGEAPIINAQELATLVPNTSIALLEYAVTDDNTYLFAITHKEGKSEPEIQVYTLPIKRDDLAKEAKALRRKLAERDLGFRAQARKLYDLLLKPAEAQLIGKTELVIAPDSALWDLPFQALLTPANRFLIKDAAIAYAPSLTVLREMTRRRQSQRVDRSSATLLALGNPLVGTRTIRRPEFSLRDEPLASLPEAEQEVKALRRLYGISRSKVYIGADAGEGRVKSEAGQARVLHFAAHGILNNASPMYSHLALAQGDANEDGLLEAWELMQLDLKADLAVLSACETARGRIGAGEGMIGLSWAMFIAGVPSTVVSQWKVEAGSTRDLMVNFHRGLISNPGPGKSKLTKAESLRQAALMLMKNPETRHPFYWAGFVLVGDGK